ncbi:MAG: cell division protein SepF [Acidimicrobiia bacterium]|nr:cell division protein SepF [Acidimicrobiia bacterium]NNK92516.1 cell division protein SepF [Acidimicrobiia bacterium]
MASSWQKVMFFLGLVDEEESTTAEEVPAFDTIEPLPVESETGVAETPVVETPQAAPQAEPQTAAPVPIKTHGGVAGRRVEPPTKRRRRLLGDGDSGSDGGGTVTPIPAGSTEIIVAKVFSDAQRLADMIRERRAVVLDLRSTEPEMVRRLVDFSSGLTYALDGTMRKINQGVILVAPGSFALPDHERDRLVGLGLYAASVSE